MSESIRINKFLSEAGFCSRRQADRLIEQKAVRINGQIALQGAKVTSSDIITVNNELITLDEKAVLLAYNKPLGVVCSTTEKDNIIDYINYPVRIYPVGRLDKNSEGLILLTNQGDIMDAILRAANYHEKEYIVKVNKDITKDFINSMEKGVPILDTITRPCTIHQINDRTFTIIITQGLNRQIRRMCEYFNYRVISLRRVRIMDIKLGKLKVGEYKEFTTNEIEQLRLKLGIGIQK